ncbi:telomere repeats-binding bouquet formation protein 1 [Heterodontus francisci]|uniref:telomere repeats-binding bouquet formation protein 1 n=1 Tax=Heterodontus francisci TaxID=7792 RepID=UPI00355B8018
MESPERADGNRLCGLKTDLNLLLECLKYQMDSPVTQKQALITIQSICQQNIYCQQSLCTAELLSDVALSLAQKDASLILKRMNVYVMLVLVSHNKIGQTLARTTGCIDVLLNLFRTSFPMLDKQSIHENIGQCYELWSSIGSTLCACVNNPQNEENQRLCIAAFPFAKDCLQKCIRQEVIRPISAFIGLTVANNSYVQDYFCKVGGLDALAQALVRLVDESIRHHSSTELAVAVTKTLDSCISENSSLASCLSEYLIVPKLVELLSQSGLDISSKLGIILAIGHCTDGCEVHQYQLLQSNGLPLMIQIVAESQDEEQRKAATFVLQSCQLITERLSNSLVENFQQRGDTVPSYRIDYPKDNSLKNYWKFAEEFMNRIKALEKQQEEQMTNGIVNTGDADVHKTATGTNSHMNLKFQSCESIDQMAKEREAVPMKRCNEQHSFDKSCVDSTKMDKWTGGTRRAKNQDFTPVKRKFNFSHAADEYREEDSVIPAINSSYSRTEENRSQYRDQRLMDKVRRQIFVEDDVAQEAIKKNTNADQFGNVDNMSSFAKARDTNSQQHDVPIGRASNGGPNAPPATQNRDVVPETDQQYGAKFWFVECGKPTNQPVTIPEAEVPTPSTSRKEQKFSDKQDFKKKYDTSSDGHNPFKRPPPISRKRSKQNYIEPLILCADLIDNEISSILTSPAPSLIASQDFRCSEVLLTPIKKTASHMTNFHRQTDFITRPKPATKDVHIKKVLLTPIKKSASHMTNFHRQQTDFITRPKPATKDVHIKKILLTPIKKTASHITNFHRQQTDFITRPKPSTKDVHVKKFLLTPMKKSAPGTAALPRQRRDDTTPFKPTVGQGHVNSEKNQ